MRKALLLALTFLFSSAALSAIPSAIFADQYIDGYYRKDGTYVKPHWRSDPDGDPYNNYSYPGNLNPYTRKRATGDPDSYLERYYGEQDYDSYDSYDSFDDWR